MKAKHLIGVITGVILGVSITSVAIGCASNIASDNASSKYSRQKLDILSSLLKKSYLRDIDNKKVEDSIYAGYVSGLEDPATGYLGAEQLKEQQALEQGKYMGTGLQFEWGLNGRYIIVTDVIPNSPAAAQNIHVGDKIVEIDGIKVMMSNETELYEKLAYNGSDEVAYTFQDNNGNNERIVKLTSKIIDVKSMTHKMIRDNVGYISIFSIKKDSSAEFEKNIKALQVSGAKSFIIDIRNAYSNNLDEIYKMAGLFIDNQVVFKLKNKQGKMKEYKTTKAAFNEPIAIVVNEKTRGAFEAFAVAVKDTKRGKVIGVKTAGAGCINQIFTLEDKTGVMVTTGIIHSSSDISLKGAGVVPNTEIKNSTDSIIELVTTGTVQEKDDLQLMEAIKQLQ